ncbi:MAG: hypothetical protein Ct9H300mP6_15030 [Gammaproteobacteria bacterium]|nr:MAG: hypothetical protein Ct9H300mP6_15030 [Gammaproteobacteria bacterium]
MASTRYVNNKQNVFDDFIAAAEYLHNQNFQAGRTAIEGRSNGGLLVGARCFRDLIYFGVAFPV